MQISELKAEHIDMVAELEALSFAHPLSKTNLGMLLPDGIGHGFVIVDEEKGVAAAYGGIMTVLDEGQILNIATHPEYRRRGLGEMILEAIISDARVNKISFITLEVRESNEAARSLYEKKGFYQVGRLKGYYDSPREDGLILKLDL
jgi:ribosomal-protein-alanine N-acetyltransferase